MPNRVSKYKLVYFDARGFGEAARQLFHLDGVQFEDVRISFEELRPGKSSESYLALKDKTPFGKFPVLSIDDLQIGQSSAVNRYLAKHFGYAGKTPEEEAWVDAIVDQYKDYMESFSPFIFAQRAGKSKEEVKEVHDKIFAPTKDMFLKQIESVMKKNSSWYLVGSRLTWADLVIADHLHTLDNINEVEDYEYLKNYQERIYSLPELKEHIQTRPVREM